MTRTAIADAQRNAVTPVLSRQRVASVAGDVEHLRQALIDAPRKDVDLGFGVVDVGRFPDPSIGGGTRATP